MASNTDKYDTFIMSLETTTNTVQAAAATSLDRDLLTPVQFVATLGQPGKLSRARAALQIWSWNASLQLRRIATRALDLLGAGIGILVLSPLLLVTTAAIRLESRGPILFSQTRVGLNGRLFTMYKFRSMSQQAEQQKAELMSRNESEDGVLFKMRADPRITRVGRVIRRLSIDELPQLLNIIRGDMSIVGPRPPLPQEVDLYDAHARKRLQTKPGLTCIWQISGRSDIPFKQQVDLDLLYMQDRSVPKNVEIILRTVPAVLSGKGAY